MIRQAHRSNLTKPCPIFMNVNGIPQVNAVGI